MVVQALSKHLYYKTIKTICPNRTYLANLLTVSNLLVINLPNVTKLMLM